MYLPNRINPIVKLTEKCNYSCDFCRYSKHRQYDTGTSEKLVIKMILECYEYNRLHNNKNMNVIFHGGEPLLYGAERLVQVLQHVQKSISDDFLIEYSVQTNSSLISDEWIKVFKDYNFEVGISLDGPISLNGHYGENRDNAVYSAITKYHMLKENHINCGFLSVITDKHLERLNDFFAFYIDNRIDSIGLCYCYNKFDGNCVNPQKLGEWLIDLYELYFNAPRKIKIREFDMITRRVLKHPRNACSMSCRESCGEYITITPVGKIEFCDDYDLDEGRSNSIGDLSDNTLLDILSNEKYQEMKINSLKIVEKKCIDCEVFDLCRCGCSRNDFENGNYFCDTYKILYPYIRDRVQKYLKEREL